MSEPSQGDDWEEATFAGHEQAQRRRVSRWTPQERLAWLDAQVLEAHRSGVLAEVRERKQREVEALWSGRAPEGADVRPRS